jgi:chromate transporter
MNLLVLYAEFFKIGIFSIGGGLATLPFLFQLTGKYSWFGAHDVSNFLAVAQSAPGAVGVNMAAQAGFHCAGISGAIIAALGLVSPAIIVITVIARMLTAFSESKTAAAVFQGFRPAAAGLLAAAGFGVWKLVLIADGVSGGPWYKHLHLKQTALFIAFFIAIRKFALHPVICIIAAGIAGIALKL